MSLPSPAVSTPVAGGRAPGCCSRPCSRLFSSWVEETTIWANFCLEARRHFRNTASAMTATPATPAATPAMMGVEAEDDFWSEGVVTGMAVEVVPEAGAGVGAGEVSGSDRAGEAVGARNVNAAEGDIGCIYGRGRCCAFGACSKLATRRVGFVGKNTRKVHRDPGFCQTFLQ